MRRYQPQYRKITEDDIETYLFNEVVKIGGMCIKGNPRNNRGMPDRVCVLPKGLVVFVEVKRPGLKPRANQRYYAERLTDMGHSSVYVDTKGKVDLLIKAMVNLIKTKTTTAPTGYYCNDTSCTKRMRIL